MASTLSSGKLSQFGISVFTEFTKLALEHRAINLSQGYPDFDGPDQIKQVACEKILHGHNQYAPSPGMPVLRQAISDKWSRFYQYQVDPEDEVTVFAGATEAIFSCLMGLIEPGDEVILFDPCYDSYPPSVVMAGGVVRRVPLHFPDYAIDEQTLRQAFNKKTRAVVINSPMNPCGKVMQPQELQLIAQLCCEHDVLAITDEVYEHITFGQAQHIPLITLPGMAERTVSISSTAKTFSLTGWKIGYAVASGPLSAAIRASHQFVTFCSPPPLQEAMAFAIGMDDDYYTGLQRDYDGKRALMVEGLRQLGFEVTEPQGTYYIAAAIKNLGFDDDYAFCRALPQRLGVAAIPVSAFYQQRQGLTPVVRVAFCKNEPTLREALGRLQRLTVGGMA